MVVVAVNGRRTTLEPRFARMVAWIVRTSERGECEHRCGTISFDFSDASVGRRIEKRDSADTSL